MEVVLSASLPFSAVSSSVSLTIIPANDGKGLGIVSVISQRTVKHHYK